MNFFGTRQLTGQRELNGMFAFCSVFWGKLSL